MRVWIDQQSCLGGGCLGPVDSEAGPIALDCAELCPSAFVILEDGLAYVRENGTIFSASRGEVQGADGIAEISYVHDDAILESAEMCPRGCIHIEGLTRVHLGGVTFHIDTDAIEDPVRRALLIDELAGNDGSAAALTRAGFMAEALEDLELADVCFRRAAETGDPLAMFNFGAHLDEHGRQDEAVKWWIKAARQGEPHSAHNLGNGAYDRGELQEAEQWWRQAAQAGEPGSMHNLANLLQKTGRAEEAKQWRANAAAPKSSVEASRDR